MGNYPVRTPWQACPSSSLMYREVRVRRRRTVDTGHMPTERQLEQVVGHAESYAMLPDVFLEAVLSHLNSDELAICSMVNRNWRRVANRHSLWKPLMRKENVSAKDGAICDCGRMSNSEAAPHIFLEPPCQLKLHYGQYRIDKKRFANGKWLKLALEHQCGLIQASFSNEDKLVISGKTLKIWDISRTPTLLYNSSKHLNTVDIQLHRDALLLLKENRKPPDYSDLTERYIDIYRCVSVTVRGRPKIELQHTKRMDVSMTSEFRWFAGIDWLATVKSRNQENDGSRQTVLESFSLTGKRKARFLFPGDKSVVAGLTDGMYLYIILAEDLEAYEPAVPAVYCYNMISDKLKWACSLIDLSDLTDEEYRMDTWHRYYITITAAQRMCWMDKSNGNILSWFNILEDRLEPYSEKGLCKERAAYTDPLIMLNYFKSRDVASELFGEMGYIVSPYGTVLACVNDRIYMCTATHGKSWKKSVNIRDNMTGIDHLRSCTKYISKTKMVLVCDNQKNVLLFKFPRRRRNSELPLNLHFVE